MYVSLMLVEVEFDKILHSCIAFANGNRAIDVVICSLTVFGRRVERMAGNFSYTYQEGGRGLTTLDDPLLILDLIQLH